MPRHTTVRAPDSSTATTRRRHKRQKRSSSASHSLTLTRSGSGARPSSETVSAGQLLCKSLIHELDGHVFYDVAEVSRYFVGAQQPATRDVNDDRHDDIATDSPIIAACPSDTSDAAFVPWLVAALQAIRGMEGDLVWVDGRGHKISSTFGTSRSPDFALVTTSSALCAPFKAELAARVDNESEWKHIHIVGDHESSGESRRQTFLQLADYAAHVFAHQPLRVCVLAALTFKSRQLRLFVFDRGGALASPLLPIDAQHLGLLASVPATKWTQMVGAGVLRMPQSLGGGVIEMGETVCRRSGIVCRGTYCAVARIATPRGEGGDGGVDQEYVARDRVLIKLSWRAEARRNEGALLEEAASKGVIGIVQHIHHADITDVHALRQTLVTPVVDCHGGGPGCGAQRPGKGKELPCGTPFPLKTVAKSVKSPSSSSSSALSPSLPSQQQEVITFPNRIYTCVVMSTIGIPVSRCTSAQQIAHALLAGLIGHASLYFTGGLLHRDVSADNVLYCHTPTAIDGTPDFLPHGLGSLNGILIDLDYATPITTGGSVVSGAPHRTGTLPFMAVGVLEAQPHRYHHGLESFLYLLIWVCNYMEADGCPQSQTTNTSHHDCIATQCATCHQKPIESKWHSHTPSSGTPINYPATPTTIATNTTAITDLSYSWESGSIANIVLVKSGQMTYTHHFDAILSTFSPSIPIGLKEVAHQWRAILFKDSRQRYRVSRRRYAHEGVDPEGKTEEGQEEEDEEEEDEDVFLITRPRAGYVKPGLREWDAFRLMRDALFKVMVREGWI